MNISAKSIEAFFQKTDDSFPIPLSHKVNIHEFAKKLHDKGTLCVECSNREILSMVAGYTDNVINNIGYISLVATLPEARNQGLAQKLVAQFLEIAREKGLDAVHLYAVPSNKSAIRIYDNLGFVRYFCANEPRPDDLHLIYRYKEEK